MYVKNLEPQPITDEEYIGLRKEGHYKLPHLFKYVAWFIVIAILISTSTVLVLYGMTFGMVKTYVCLGAFLTSFILSSSVAVPIKIFLFTIINSILLKKKPVLIKRIINPLLLSNPDNPVKKTRILKFRKYNANLYSPTPLYKLQRRLEDIKYNLELRQFTTDLLLYSMFVLSGLYIVLINKTPMAFYSNEKIVEVFLNASHTKTIHFSEVNTHDKLLKYLNETFLPALLKNQEDGVPDEKPNKFYRRKRQGWENSEESWNPLPTHERKRKKVDNFEDLIDGGKEKNVFDFGWTVNFNLKLLGKARFRQVRVMTGSCKKLEKVKARNLECAPDLNLFNVETGNFSLRWKENSQRSGEMQAAPWIYRTAWESGTLPIFAKVSTYPGGGYILELAKHIDDARLILEYMDTFQWVDVRTRALFVEFTLYCVNTNLFNVVTLIFEKTATGYIIPSHKIETCKLILMENEYEVISLAVLSFLFFLVVFFLLRESLRVHRTSLKLYVCRTHAALNVGVIIFGILSVVFIFVRNNYVLTLLKKLEEAENNKFISFIYAANWHSWSIYIEAVLVCLAFFKLFYLLTFSIVFFRIQTTLSQCYRHFVDLLFQQLVLIIAFAFFFNLTLLYYAEGFSTVGLSLSTVIGRAAAVDDYFDYSVFINGSWFLAPLFFVLFVIFITILFINIFIAVLCLYFRKIGSVALTEKYNVSEYIRFLLTLNRQRDILHIKVSDKVLKKNQDPAVMRLKGGGNKLRKMVKKLRELRSEEEEEEEEEDLKEVEEIQEEIDQTFKINLKDMVTTKSFDMTVYKNLEVERDLALKNVMAFFLSSDKEKQQIFSGNYLRALFCSFTTKRKPLKNKRGEYFFVTNEFGTSVYSNSVLLKMRNVVENLGIEKDLVLGEEAGSLDISGLENKFAVLEYKLSLLLKKFNSK